MKRLVLFMFGLSSLLCGCGSSDEDVADVVVPQTGEEQPGEDTPGGEPGTGVETRSLELTKEQSEAVARNNDFAFDFVRAVASGTDAQRESFVVSPLSLTFALGMLNAGADGNTGEELTRVLGFGGESRESVNALCRTLIDGAPVVDEKVKLRLADMVAVRDGLQLTDDYSSGIAENYRAESVSLPFGNPEAVDYVNSWCSRNTDGVIPRIVDSFSAQTVLALLNAVYFKAPWSGMFDASATRPETFTREDGTTVEVPMMRRIDATYYAKGNDFSTIGIPYGDGKHWTMYVLLPSEGKTVADVLSQLSQRQWSELKAPFAYGGMDVDVWLPRFSAESDLNLENVLKSMGLVSMFAARGELGMFANKDVKPYVSLVRQHAAIDVTEEGTEAAAVTIVAVDGTAAPDSGKVTIPEFHATRPFVYLIQEETTGAIFFVGAYRGN